MYFVANRTDGFGERLRALLNAMVAADHYGGSTMLDWQVLSEEFAKFNDVLPIRETFSASFLEGRHVSRATIASLRTIEPEKARFTLDGRIGCEDDVDAIVMDQRPIGRQLTPLDGVPSQQLYRKAFNNICFTPPLEAARALARSVEIGDGCIALHLRAGDIVYGKFRAVGGFTNKAVPYPVIEALIAQACAAGGDVILFGQDAELCRHLAARHKIWLAADFAADSALDKYQSALFEICLMARCKLIYSGSSGFATLASWVGSAKSLTVDKVFNQREIVDIVLGSTEEMTDKISDLQKAYASFYILQRCSGQMSKAEKRTAIDRCIALDPENALYRIIDAAFLYTQHMEAKAEARLVKFSRATVEWDMAWILSYTPHTNMIRNHLPSFKAPAESGHPMAAICLALREQALGNMDEAAKYAGIYRVNKGDLDTPLDLLLKV